MIKFKEWVKLREGDSIDSDNRGQDQLNNTQKVHQNKYNKELLKLMKNSGKTPLSSPIAAAAAANQLPAVPQP